MKRLLVISLLIAFTLTLSSPASAAGNSYYVSNSGSDSNPGTLSAPWKTIQFAANSAAAGDTIFIRGGTYNERVYLHYKSNTAYITFANYSGESVILDGTGIDITGGEGLFQVTRSNFIRINGLTVQHSNGAGIESLYSDNFQVLGNHTIDTVKSGISTWGSNNVLIDGNDIAQACNAHSGYIASEENITIASGGEGINIKDGSHDVQVHNNIVHLDGRTDGKPSNRLAFGLDGWTDGGYNVSFYNNEAFGAATGFVVESEAGGTVHDVQVYNNTAHDNSGAGFYMPDWAQNETSLKQNVSFTNNVAYNNGIGIYFNSIAIQNITAVGNDFARNTVPVQYGAAVPQAQISFGGSTNAPVPTKTNAPAQPTSTRVPATATVIPPSSSSTPTRSVATSVQARTATKASTAVATRAATITETPVRNATTAVTPECQIVTFKDGVKMQVCELK